MTRNASREAAGDLVAEVRQLEQLEEHEVRIIVWLPDIALRNPSNNPVRYVGVISMSCEPDL
jgi:hypothetical protein